MTEPYRENPEGVPERKEVAPGVEPLTPGELAFWDAVYAAFCPRMELDHETKASGADQAVRHMTAKHRYVEEELTTIAVCEPCGLRVRAATRWEETDGKGWVTPRRCDACDAPNMACLRFFRWRTPILADARRLVAFERDLLWPGLQETKT